MDISSLVPGDVTYYLDRFNRVDYKAAFAEYKSSCGDFLSSFDESDAEAAAEQLVTELDGRIKGLWKSRKLLDLQYFLIMYLSPYLLSDSSGKGAALSEALCRRWRSAHPQNAYEPGSYEELASGFNDTVLGFKLNIGRGK